MSRRGQEAKRPPPKKGAIGPFACLIRVLHLTRIVKNVTRVQKNRQAVYFFGGKLCKSYEKMHFFCGKIVYLFLR